VFDSHDPTATQAAPYPRLLGDIGGTNARFGWQTHEGAEISQVQVLLCAEHASLLAAAQHYLQHQGLTAPLCAAFGMANPVTGDQVVMTNHHLLLLNDFTALALSLTQLPEAQKQQIGGGHAVPHAAIGLIGPGTGLGVSGLLPVGHSGQWLPIAGEGGHVSLSAANAHEFAVIQELQKRYGHVSAERVLSGAGLVDLYRSLCEINGDEGESGRDITTPADVLARAQAVPLSTAHEALDLFCGFLGSVAGDLALTLGARGGLYIGGGIVPRLGARFAASPFRARFEDKGRFKTYLEEIPTWVIQSPVAPALLGASQALSLSL
jgi:glucokinase